MCRICFDYQKGLLTKEEAKKNVGELIDSALIDIVSKNEDRINEEEFHHLLDLSEKLLDKDPNTDMD